MGPVFLFHFAPRISKARLIGIVRPARPTAAHLANLTVGEAVYSIMARLFHLHLLIASFIRLSNFLLYSKLRKFSILLKV